MSPRRRHCLALSAGAWLWPATARAAPWPRGAYRLTSGYPPGGVSDEVARALAERLAAALGVAVTVDYQPGAGGAVALEALSRAAPDAQRLVFCAINPLTVQPHLATQRAAGLHAVVPVAAVMETPALVLGTPALAARDFADLLQRARRQPGRLRWATSGVATTGHLLMAQVCRAAALDIVHVPYKGGGQQINDALAGHFEVLSSNVAALQLGLVAQGRLSALAVGAAAPVAALPRTPTLAELGFPAANLSSVFAVFAPPATPAATVQRLNGLIDAAVHEAALQQRLRAAGSEPLGGPPAALAERIAQDAARHRDLLLAAPESFR